jgi:oxygen-independent coproporphyrinogen-3 oxidase
VQSLSDKELAALGRIHTAAQARDRLRVAVAAGLDVSADLMCALSGQTTQSWASTLAGVMDCGVGHVSVYPLQIEEGTPFGERYADDTPPWNDPDLQAAYMEQAQDMLEAGGFARYEVASYARPGKACAHNLSYWSGRTYLGLGTRASSMLSREAYERLRTVAHQLPELGGRVRRVRLTCTADACTVAKAGDVASLPFSLELLDEAQAAAEDLMLGMRMTTGVDRGLLEHARKVLGEGRVDDTLLSCVRRGLVSCEEGRFAPTHVGWLRGNELFGALWELAPGRVEELEVPQRS